MNHFTAFLAPLTVLSRQAIPLVSPLLNEVLATVSDLLLMDAAESPGSLGTVAVHALEKHTNKVSALLYIYVGN